VELDEERRDERLYWVDGGMKIPSFDFDEIFSELTSPCSPFNNWEMFMEFVSN
jgi:hypothetical protein